MEKKETKMVQDRKILYRAKEGLKILTVEPFMFFCLLGYIVRLVSFQSLLMETACRNLYNYSEDICKNLEAHKKEQDVSIEAGNNLYLGIMLLGSLPAVVVAIFLGPWSDKYSRKYPLLISAGGMFLESLFSAIFTIFPTISPYYFVACSIFAGVSGGFVICASAAFSYLSDITDERSRPSRFAVLEFFNISAIVIGNLLGGQIYQAYGYLTVMSLSPLTFALGLLYAVFFLKETKPPVPKDKRFEMFRDLFQLDNIKQSYITCSKKRPGNIRLQIWLLVLISCMQKFADMGTLAVGFPFARKMYDWTVTDFSNASMAFYIVNAFITILVLPVLSNNLRLHEAAMGLIGMLSLVSKLLVTALATRDFMFYFAWMTGTLANAAGIAVRSRLSKLVHYEERGRAFSLLGTCESLTPLVGSTVFLQIYNLSQDVFPGMPFAVSALLLMPCAIIFAWMMRLPTVSLAEYERNEIEKHAQPMETISSSVYRNLKEEKC